jgi:hypothetical protein
VLLAAQNYMVSSVLGWLIIIAICSALIEMAGRCEPTISSMRKAGVPGG